MRSTIAIIEPEYLVAAGLQQCLEAMLPSAEVVIYQTVELCMADIERKDGKRPFFVHFFVNAVLLQQHADYFRSLTQITIALVRGNLHVAGFPNLDVSGTREQVFASLLNLHNNTHQHKTDETLSQRETDVLRCVAKGMINKEIAEALCISVNTVITHRQHITVKTHLHSVAALTMYALMNNLVSFEEINL